jgi:hypothetical protein
MRRNHGKAGAFLPRSAALTAFLVLTVCFLTGAIISSARRPMTVTTIPSNLPTFETSTKLAFERELIGEDDSEVRVTNIQILDFDDDGRNDVLVCDAARNSVVLYRREGDGAWQERVLAQALRVPSCARVVDLDGDGDKDVVVAVRGGVRTTDDAVGKVIWLENDGGAFTHRRLLEDVRAVNDVQTADLDEDGDIDISVTASGAALGQISWLENRGEGRFRNHLLHRYAGGVQAQIGDLDADGDLDVAAIVSHDGVELWAFESLGSGRFTPRRLYLSHNFDLGGAGLVLTDVDGDGDPDLLMPVGDNPRIANRWPQPYDGCLYFENLGGWDFRHRRIARFGSASGAAAGDIDGDGDVDVVLVSKFNDGHTPPRPTSVWLENDGGENFLPRKIDTAPRNLVTVACGDLNGDGRADIVAGGFRQPPFRAGGAQRATVWLSLGASP